MCMSKIHLPLELQVLTFRISLIEKIDTHFFLSTNKIILLYSIEVHVKWVAFILLSLFMFPLGQSLTMSLESLTHEVGNVMAKHAPTFQQIKGHYGHDNWSLHNFPH